MSLCRWGHDASRAWHWGWGGGPGLALGLVSSGVVFPGRAMHGPRLGPHVGQRSREAVCPGRGRQALLWVKGIRLAPQTGGLSVQVWFLRVWPLWSDCGQPGQQAVPSRARSRDKDQKAARRRRWRLPSRVPPSHPLTSTGNSRFGAPCAPPTPRVAALSPRPPQPVPHHPSQSELPFIRPDLCHRCLFISPSWTPPPLRTSPPFCPENAREMPNPQGVTGAKTPSPAPPKAVLGSRQSRPYGSPVSLCFSYQFRLKLQ